MNLALQKSPEAYHSYLLLSSPAQIIFGQLDAPLDVRKAGSSLEVRLHCPAQILRLFDQLRLRRIIAC